MRSCSSCHAKYPPFLFYFFRLAVNRVGVSDERQAKINELMSKLRARGQVGDSSEMAGAETFMAKPPPPPPVIEEQEVEEPVAEGLTTEATAEVDAAAPEAAAEEDGELKKTTSGIGGAWSGKRADVAKKEVYAPKVSTWGVFERPDDISKAYGGGRQVGVGGYQPTAEEIAAKKKITEEKLAKFRKGQGADLEVQKEHEEEITAALKEARQLMRFGATRGALDELEAVREWCCAATELGSETLLELGMTLIAAGDPEGAKPVLVQLQARAPKTNIKRAAKQMLFQEEAQDFLKVNERDPNAEFAKLGRMGLKQSLGVASDKRYDLSAAYLTSTKRPPVSSISEARQVLRSAAVRRDDAGAPQRIMQALDLLPTLPLAERLPKAAKKQKETVGAAVGDGGGAGLEREKAGVATASAAASSPVAAMLCGEWLLGFTTAGRSISFAPDEATQMLERDGKYERLAPGVPVGLVRTVGTYAVDEAAPSSKLSAPCLRFEVDSASLGPLPLPTLGRGGEERVVLLDPLMCVTQPGAGEGFSIWVRPSMWRAKGSMDDDDFE